VAQSQHIGIERFDAAFIAMQQHERREFVRAQHQDTSVDK
jgi:hypothetical protein